MSEPRSLSSTDDTFSISEIESRIVWLREFIDSESHAAEIEDLEDEISELVEAAGDAAELELKRARLSELINEANDLDTKDEEDELARLEGLKTEFGSTYDDPNVLLIRGGYFLTYAQDYARGFGELRESDWPFNHIDWESAAVELKMDYHSVEFDDEDWYYRR